MTSFTSHRLTTASSTRSGYGDQPAELLDAVLPSLRVVASAPKQVSAQREQTGDAEWSSTASCRARSARFHAPVALRICSPTDRTTLRRRRSGDEPFGCRASATFPPGEDIFVRSVKRFADRITDPELSAQMRGFVGQEVAHGRHHNELNQRLAELGYPTHRVDRRIGGRLAFLGRRLSALTTLAITAALEHYMARWAETMLGVSAVRSQLLWQAYEESEHKAAAFDVYRTVGGTERRRIRVMRCTTLIFVLCIVRNTVVSLTADRDTRNLARLVRSVAGSRHSPFLSTRTLERIRAYNTPGCHPNDVDATDILSTWHPELFSVAGPRV